MTVLYQGVSLRSPQSHVLSRLNKPAFMPFLRGQVCQPLWASWWRSTGPFSRSVQLHLLHMWLRTEFGWEHNFQVFWFSMCLKYSSIILSLQELSLKPDITLQSFQRFLLRLSHHKCTCILWDYVVHSLTPLGLSLLLSPSFSFLSFSPHSIFL